MTPLPPSDLPAGSRVVVAMSGGVDSSVVAATLHAQGHEVVGVTLQLYDRPQATAKSRTCCAGVDIRDARGVADGLGISHYVIDMVERFKKAVIQDFADSYAAGRTPIPCVRCNERIKFADLLEVARDLGAAALATGHYVQRVQGPQGAELHRGQDESRDQSYFLYRTTPAQLDYLRFPLGGLAKTETRALAASFGLEVAGKPDSQDICFVPDGDHAATVGAMRPDALEPGPILHQDGRALGQHRGIARYTVGQRRGLGVAVGEPLHVVAIEAGTRRITVAPRARAQVGGAILSEPCWLAEPPDGPVLVKHRANEPAVPARLVRGETEGWRVAFEQPQGGVAPGQACVAYAGSRLLGGGWIATAAP